MLKRLSYELPPFSFVLVLLHLYQGLGNHGPGAESDPLPVFMNKGLGEHFYVHPLMYFPQLLSSNDGRVERLCREFIVPKSLKYFPSGLSQKAAADP